MEVTVENSVLYRLLVIGIILTNVGREKGAYVETVVVIVSGIQVEVVRVSGIQVEVVRISGATVLIVSVMVEV